MAFSHKEMDVFPEADWTVTRFFISLGKFCGLPYETLREDAHADADAEEDVA